MTDLTYDQQLHFTLIDHTVSIVKALVANGSGGRVAADVKEIYAALRDIGAPVIEQVDKPTAVQIKASITNDWLISFEDGKRYKTLRRHLSKRGLTPEEYRAKWGLPSDYPLTAPGYSARRSEMAKEHGLGKK